MNKEIKQKWLEALRSGKYRKGTHALKRKFPENTEAEYCCLGVFCEICGLKPVSSREAFSGITYFSYQFDNEAGEEEFPPDALVTNMIGEKSMYAQKLQYLSSINDRADTFDEAIEFIEKTL